MVTAITNDQCYEFRGLSSDTKPIEQVGNGSTFFEMDTCKLFMFDATNQQWLDVSSIIA